MSQQYTPVDWQDPAGDNPGTLINKARLDQMQSAHHYADGLEEVDTVPTANPGVAYHKIVFCTADNTIYRWNGTQWTKDIDDDTKALLDAEILRAKAAEEQNADAIEAETARAELAEESNADRITALENDKADKATTLAGYGITDGATQAELGAVSATASAKYTKPADGIPKSDLDSGVQTSLGKADTAVQHIPDISVTTSGAGSFVQGISATGHALVLQMGTPSVASVGWDGITDKPELYTQSETDALLADKADASTVSALADEVAEKYTKPAGGIPDSDLSAGVQASLGKADTALQSHQPIKTINGDSLVGTGNVLLQTPLTAGTDYVVPVSGKGLSANDYTDADKAKLTGIAAGAQVNVIETIQANGTPLTPSGKAVNISIPTKTSQITNDSDYTTASAVASIYLSQADAATTYATKSEITSVFRVKGSKATVADLPSTGNVTGDVWNILDTGSNYVWDGTQWDKLSETVDLSGYVPKTTTVNGHALSSDISVTKADVGLGNCDNTSDLDKPISTATQNALNSKLDDSQLITTWSSTVLNTNIPSEKLVKNTLDTKYIKPSGGIPKTDLASDVQTSLGKADTAVQAIKTINSESMVGPGNIPLQTPLTAGTDYVVPVSGKGLSANDYTDADKSKLAGIEAGAQVNIIESIEVNGTPLTPSSKTVDITLTASDVGALPDSTPYAGASIAGGKATSAAVADAVPWAGITDNPLQATDITLTES